MKFTATVLFSLLLTFAVARAQSDGPLVESGDFGLTFQINGFGNFGVTGIQSGSIPMRLSDDPEDPTIFLPLYGIGVKTFVSDQIALRGALGINYNSRSTPTLELDSAGNPVETERTDDAFAAGLGVGMEYHFPAAGPVSGYAGFTVGFSSNVLTTGEEDAQVSESGSVFTLGPILGAEVFPWDNFSLGLEYMLGLAVSSTSTKVGDQETDGPSDMQIGTGALSVRASLYIK